MSRSSFNPFKPSVLFDLMSKGFVSKRESRQAQRAPARRKMVFEAVEQRVLLSADLPVVLSPGHDDVTLRAAYVAGTEMIQVVDNKSGVVLGQGAVGDVDTLSVTGTAANERIRIDLSSGVGNKVNTGIEVDGADGDDTIEVYTLGFEGLSSKPISIDAGTTGVDQLVVTAGRDVELTNTHLYLSKSAAIDTDVTLGGTFESAVLTGFSVSHGAFTQGIVIASTAPVWAEQGPGPLLGGLESGIAPTNDTGNETNPVSGAIHAVLTDPGNANVVYIGAVGGGVWKTTDGGVHWTPLTDHMPSLTISALAFDRADASHQTIYAGTGKVSSYYDYGKAVGLMKSTDGGKSWVQLGAVEFDDQAVNSIIANGSSIVVSTDKGLYRSFNGGVTFSRVLDRTINGFGIAAAGLGYEVGGLVSITSPTHKQDAEFRITSVSVTGAVTGLQLLRLGSFTAAEVTAFGVNPVATNGGGDGNLKLTLTFTDTGMVDKPVTETVVDPDDPSHMWAGVAKTGVYRSTDAGVSWTLLTGSPKSFDMAARIRLSFSEAPSGTSDVFVGIVRNPQYMVTANASSGNQVTLEGTAGIEVGDKLSLFTGFGVPATESIAVTAVNRATGVVTLASDITGNYVGNTAVAVQGELRAMWILRAEDDLGDASISWTLMDTPGDSYGGINPGGQAINNFSMLADRNSRDVVYVGGDTQTQDAGGGPAADSNPVNWTGRLFKGDLSKATGSQWTAITGDQANGSAPHSDSRNMRFDAAGNLIEVDDGGIKRLNGLGTGAQKWVSLDGDLRITEFVSVSYDPNNDVIAGGAQDNGFSIQSQAGDWAWNHRVQGDGAITDVSIGSSSSKIYGSSQNLGGLGFFTGPTDSFINGVDLEVNGTGWFDDTEIEAFEGSVPFYTRWLFNRTDEDMMLLGTDFLYEYDPDFLGILSDPGDDLTLLNGAPVKVDGKFSPDPNAKVGEVISLDYGGKRREAGVLNTYDRVGYAAVKDDVNGRVLVRLPGDEGFTPIASWTDGAPGGAQPRDIIMDPEDWRRVYVVDASGHVWMGMQSSPDTADYDWTEVSGNIAELTTAGTRRTSLDTIEIYWDEGANAASDADDTRVLLVGGQGGVFRTTNPVGNAAVWGEFGTGMPNVRVTDLHYDETDDLLLAGTLGRGALTISNASAWLKQDSVLTIIDKPGVVDSALRLVVDSKQPWLLDVFSHAAAVPEPSKPTAQVGLEGIDRMQVFTLAGDDQVEIDSLNGVVFVPKGISLDGGSNTGTGDTFEANFLNVIDGAAGLAGIDATSLDAFGVAHKVSIAVADFENVPTTLTPYLSPAATTGGALAAMSSSFQQLLRESLAGQDVGFLKASAVSSGVNGTVVDTKKPPGLKTLVSTATSVPGGSVQVDDGQSIISRLFDSDEGIFNLATLASTFTSAADLAARLDGLDNIAGNVTVSTVGGDTRYTVQIQRDLAGTFGIDIDGAALLGGSALGADALDITGKVALDFTATLNLVFGVDGDGFYVMPAASAPELHISAIHIGTGGLVASGRFGFIGVDVSSPTLSIAADAALDFKLDPSDTLADADGKIRLATLTDGGADVMGFSVHDGTGTDLTLGATLNVSAIVPGLGEVALPLGPTQATFTWEDLSGGVDVELTGAGATALSAFAKLNPADLVSNLGELKTQLGSLMAGVEFDVPFLSVGLDGLTDVLDFVDDSLLSQLTTKVGSSTVTKVTTLQSFTSALTSSLMANFTPSSVASTFGYDLGDLPSFLHFDAGSGELTYTLDFARDFALSDTLDLGFDLAGGLADFKTSAATSITGQVLATLTLGIDVQQAANGDSPLDWIFIKDAKVSFEAEASASNIDALARFGFVNIEVFDGEASVSLGVDVSLTDPGLNASDGRIDLNEIKGAVVAKDFDSLVDINFTGSADLDLPVKVPFLGINGSTRTADNTLLAHIDFADPDSAVFTIPPAISDLGNFGHIDAASIVGLLGQVTGWLDELRKSDDFANFDVPVLGTVLDEVLGFADTFRDQFLFDDGDDGIDGAATLIGDLNAALAAAGLSGQVHFEVDSGNFLQLVANTASVPDFTLKTVGGSALGFNDATTYDTAPTTQVLNSVTAENVAPVSGRVSGDVTLKIKIGSADEVVVTLLKASTDTAGAGYNTRIGNDRYRLVDASNTPTFSTVQELVDRVADELGLGDIITYDLAHNTLDFDLSIGGTFGSKDVSLSFLPEDLPDFLKLQTSGLLRLSASGDLNLHFGIDLGTAGGKFNSADGSGDLLSELNGGVQVSSDRRIVATNPVRSVVGALSNDSVFSITVGGQTKQVTVVKNAASGAKTSDNVTLADLVADFNAALTTAGLASQIVAAQDAGNLVLRSVVPATAFSLSTSNGDPLVKELGFLSQSSSVDVAGVQTIRTVQPALPDTPVVAPTLLGRLTGDAVFTVNLGGTSAAVTVLQSATIGNRYAFDIVNDVQAAIDATSLTDKHGSGNSSDWTRSVVVGIVGGRLTFTSKTADPTFTITGANAAATAGLGLSGGTVASDGADLVIGLRNGNSVRVDLSGATTLADVISKIEEASRSDAANPATARVDVAINARQTGLTLTDKTAGGAKFMVVAANDSKAAAQLGIVGADYPEGGAPSSADGVIEGTDIAALRPLDRFFIRETPTLGNLALSVTTVGGPNSLTAEAAFGFVGLKLQGDGTAAATLSLGLEDPEADATEDHRVTFQEVLDNVSTPAALFDLSLTGGGTFSLDVLPSVKADLSALGITVGSSASLDVVASFGDVFGGGADPSFSFQTSGFEDLLKFNNPLGADLSFQSIIQGLQALSDFLGQFESFGFLGEKLPVVNVSINDLISIADQFAEAVDQVVSNPAGTIQLLEQKLETAFGLTANPNLLTLGLVIDDKGNADASDDQSFLRISIDLAAGFDESIALELDVGQWLADETGMPDWITDSINFGGDAKLGASGSLGLVLDFGIDLAKPLDVYVFEGTAFEASLLATATDVDFRAALGPLGIFVQGGDASIDASIGLGLAAGLFTGAPGEGRIKLVDLIDEVASDPEGSVEFTLGGSASATLPVYFPTDSQYAGDVALTITDLFDPDTISLNLPDGILDFDIGSLSLLDQLLLGVDGVDLFLEGLQDLLDGNIGGVDLPLIGDKLAAGVDVIGDFRAGFLEDFRGAIQQLANPTAAFNQYTAAAAGAAIAAFSVPSGLPTSLDDVDPVSKILGNLLGSSGLDILLDANGDGFYDGRDIYFKTNLNQPGVAVTDVFFDWDIKLGGTLLDVGAGIGFDVGIPGLGLKTEGDVKLDVVWSLDLGFGLNFDDGFYLDVGNDANETFDDDVELQLNIDATIPGAKITGTLGFLQVSAEDDVDDNDDLYTHLSAVLGVDIFNGSNKNDTKLGFSELSNIDITVGIAAEAVVDLGMKLSLSSDLIPNAPTNFPSVVADFSLVWGVGDTTPGSVELVPLSELGGSFLKNGLQYVGFEHVGLDLGSYFSDLIGPIVSKVQEVTEPIKPFLDFLTADIPVISQLAGPTSLLDIAAQSGLVNPGIIEAIEVVDQVVDIVDSLKDLGEAGNVILYFDAYLPSLVIYGQKPSEGFAPLAATSTPNIDLSKAPNLDELKKYADTLDKTFPGLGSALESVTGAFKNSIEKMNGSGTAAKGFSLPIINDPSQIFGMLLGQPATLVQFDMAPLILEADYSQFFPIYGPLGVSINAEFGAQFGPFSFGYDTLGITSFADGDFRNPWLLFDGFYVSDVDAKGVDVPELQFDAGLWAAAELNLGVARGGVGGGLFAEIDFDLHDPDADGRVRIKEMAANVYNQFKYFEPALAPLALFDITGKLTAELFAFLKVDLLILQIDERWQLTDPITLLDFESDFTRVPTLASELGDGVLQLNMGKYAKQRIEGDLSDGDETFVVKQADADEVFVWSTLVDFNHNGLYDESEAQRYNASSMIIALGGEGKDGIDLSGVTANLRYEIEGNAGDDVIRLGSGTGSVGKVLGGAGDDKIWGSAGNDDIFGEGGKDEIHGGAGRDWLFGDGKPGENIREDKVRLNPEDASPNTDAYIVGSAAKATDDDDTIYGDEGEDLIFGGGGNDKLWGNDKDGLLTDAADVILGDGGEVILGLDRIVMTTRAAGDSGRLELRVTDTNKGKGGNDEIHGGDGNDHLYGGAGTDTLWGDDDDDVIFGDDGKDVAHGGANNDVVFGDGGTFAFINGALSPVITSGGDADKLYGDGGLDKLLGGAGNDLIWGGADADDAWGGVGLDVIHGDGGNDHLYGGGDPDKLYGDADDDYLEGGQGNDFVLGGSGNDLLIAGYGSDTLDGQGGSDTYKINARGGSITDLSTAYDSGTDPADTDLMILVGTSERDVVLLRAMADFYFPTLEKLIGDGPKNGLTDKIFASGESDKLAAILQVLEDSYGPHDIPVGLVDQIIDLWTTDRASALAQAIDDSYAAPAPDDVIEGNPAPTVVELKARITEILASDSRGKLDEMREAIKLLWDGYRVPGTMLDAIAQAWQPVGASLQTAVENAIKGKYLSEALVGLITLAKNTYKTGDSDSYDALVAAIDAAHDSGTMPASLKAALDTAYDSGAGTVEELVAAIKSGFTDAKKWSAVDTDTAFVALINNGGKNIERFNYRYIEGLVVNTLQGDDYVVADDVAATTTINLGDGADKVQIGQVFRSERVRDPEGELITGIDPADGFTTTEITRGWLSNGVSRATTVNGGEGNDQFTVFRNVATLNLNGNDGDDLFTVRAFALKGSSDNERARTDMKGDGGADTILYVVNAPVGIDGGDGFDTVRIVGTEFGDDFVVTDGGIFGAGLNVSYINIEKLVADGAEGDDRFFIQSTGVDVVTEVDGGLGSDSFFVGGNPSRAPVAVVSNDFKGHSGIILHSIESGDPSWNGVPVEGLSANVADNSEPMILVYEHVGITRVFEDATESVAGWAYDSYGIRLSSRPDDDVYITIVPGGQSPEDAARGFKDLEFYDAEFTDGFPGGAALGFNINTGLANLPVIKFTSSDWDQVKYVKFRAASDTAAEGTRTTFINHTAQNSLDQAWAGVQSRSVKVQMLDDDRDGVIVTPTKGANVVLENSAAGATGFTDSIDVRLTRDPSAAVTVKMRVANEQITLSGAGVTYNAGTKTYSFTVADDAAWATAKTITITAPEDTVVEGLHTDYISFEVSSADADATAQKPRFKVNGDFDNLVGPPVDIPADKPTSYLLLPDRPITDDPSEPITVWLNGSLTPLDSARYKVSGSTLTFLDANEVPEVRTGTVEIAYSYTVAGYDGSFVKDSVVDIYDEDTAMVIIDQSDSNGSLDVVEDKDISGQSANSDSYRVRLTRAPAAGETVKFKFDAVETRTTYGSTALFEEQVTVNGASEGNIVFDQDSWDDWQSITVRAINDNKLDGNDTQVFAPELQTVNKIRGPLIIEGAAGAGSLALPKPLMMPWELNKLAADGVIQAVRAVPGSEGPGAREVITVTADALDDVIARLSQQDSNIDSYADLKGKTLELSSGPGTGIVLNADRPDDVYDRFWLILEVGDVVDGKVELLVQNPSIVDPADPVVTAPEPGVTDFAITSLSVNFFADEREQVDYIFMYDDDSVANDSGVLTSSDGVVRKFESAVDGFVLTAETDSLQAVAALIDPEAKTPDLDKLIGRQLTVTVGPGRGNFYQIQALSEDEHFPDNLEFDGTKKVKLVQVSGNATTPTVRSEFRIEGGDAKGRITGFGMGPNLLFAGRPQPGGITYGDIEVLQINLGRGNDTVEVDYTTNAEDHTTKRSGDFYTLTMLDTGLGNDTVKVKLFDGDDGDFALRLNQGNDTVDATGSTLGIAVFGEAGNDTITGGDGADTLFGDFGRIDYLNSDGEIITRLGDYLPLQAKNPPVVAATDTTITGAAGAFPAPDAFGGLVGLMVQAISPEGDVQFRRIVSHTTDALTIDSPWDQVPNTSYYYRVSTLPEDQSDGTIRGPRLIWSVKDDEGGNDTIVSGQGNDYVIGGAGNDSIDAGDGNDVVAGDDARYEFKPVTVDGQDIDGATWLWKLTDPSPGNGALVQGNDSITAGAGDDIVSGGLGGDTVHGNAGRDLVAGDYVSIEFHALGQFVKVSSINVAQAGGDSLWGDADDDILIGGLGNDTAHGGDGLDVVIGDDVVIDFVGGAFSKIESATPQSGGDDTLSGDDGRDLVIGGQGADTVTGGAGNDILVGDDVRVIYAPAGTLNSIETITRGSGGADTIDGNDDDDVVIGGTGSDLLDGGSGMDLMFGDNAQLDWGLGVRDYAERFRTLANGATTLYDANGDVQIGARATPPGVQPDWAPWSIVLDQSLIEAQFGNDVIAGGAHSDMIFGQRGNDTIQGDGARTSGATAARVGGVLSVTASTESLTNDGDDYIEGNAGFDVVFGNLGQDDIVGGSSTLYSLTVRAQRDDEGDLVFGGAGTDITRNDAGDGSQGNDADMILGDNGNIYRLMEGSAAAGFVYDDAYGGRALVVRAAELIDYTPGNQTGTGDLGAADELHGESGADFIYGMTGNDVIFGEGQDDDLIGGWGHDWISGGTGDDGVLGDDGRILTSRNGLAEPLNGVLAKVQSNISTPGGVQSATINVSGVLTKAADLVPFGQAGDPLFAAQLANDVIYGGWGDDFLHGGWGDDAISGAEALDRNGYSHYARPANLRPGFDGNVLDYDTATGEFAAYDEYAPMTRLAGFVLDFDATDKNAVTNVTSTNDGADRIFGDHGNDWIVGGTGRDNLYGGWGDDLLNADDDLTTAAGLNTSPDTNTTYEDRAFGGAGRDVLIGNTGGDRLIDWVGEFNSYVVPFAPFGNATVSRTLQPQLAEFLYALSKADGADQTLGNLGDPRNGEPNGELGLVRQQDFAWQDQTGAPADPQAGNVPGGKRDVLRAADFNNGQMQALAPDSGSWQVSGGSLQVAATSNKSDAVAVYQVGDALPSYYEVLATVKVIKPSSGWDANSYVIFDYQSKTNFKFAGIDAGTNKLVMGQRTAAGWQVLKQAYFTSSIKSDTWYNLMLSVNGLTATLAVNNTTFLSYSFQPTVVDGYSYGLNWGLVGFGSNKARGALDNIAVQVVPPTATVSYVNDFAAGAGTMFDTLSIGSWVASGGRLAGTPATGADGAFDLVDLSTVTNLKTASLLEMSSTFRTAGRAGFVFDWYSSADFKFAAIDVASKQVLIGHRTNAGWFVDAAVSQSTLNATTDYILGVTVRGSSVSVTLGGQAATSFVYNAVGVDGRFGLFAKAASASFDAVTVKTNDPAVPAAQMAAATAAVTEAAAPTVTSDQLRALAAEAKRRWASVEDASILARLGAVEIVMADLPGAQLGEFIDGRITIDTDAGGYGWFIDSTPADDREFIGRGTVLQSKAGGAAAGRIDLLSVLSHEMGHAIGLGHADAGVMQEQLLPGQRATPDHWWAAGTTSSRASVHAALEGAEAAQPITVAIDWSAPKSAAQARPAATARAAGWQDRFVNHLGATAERLNPNAALRLHLPSGSSLTSRLTAL